MNPRWAITPIMHNSPGHQPTETRTAKSCRTQQASFNPAEPRSPQQAGGEPPPSPTIPTPQRYKSCPTPPAGKSPMDTNPSGHESRTRSQQAKAERVMPSEVKARHTTALKPHASTPSEVPGGPAHNSPSSPDRHRDSRDRKTARWPTTTRTHSPSNMLSHDLAHSWSPNANRASPEGDPRRPDETDTGLPSCPCTPRRPPGYEFPASGDVMEGPASSRATQHGQDDHAIPPLPPEHAGPSTTPPLRVPHATPPRSTAGSWRRCTAGSITSLYR